MIKKTIGKKTTGKKKVIAASKRTPPVGAGVRRVPEHTKVAHRNQTKKVLHAPTKELHRQATLSAKVIGIDGNAKGNVSLPKELFGAPINKQLLAQAVRVYLANQREGAASTKTRSEVEGSTRKIYRQKGTGRARHGGIRAPIFVGGGTVFGPKPRDFGLKFPKKMRRLALGGSLTAQYKDGNVIVMDGLEKLEPKTKQFAQAFKHIGVAQNTLLVIGKGEGSISRGARNIEYIDILPAYTIHTYAVLSHRKLVITKDALKQLEELYRNKV